MSHDNEKVPPEICKHKGIDLQTVDNEDTEKALTAKQYKKPFDKFCKTLDATSNKSQAKQEGNGPRMDLGTEQINK